jgi:hypothetical protein
VVTTAWWWRRLGGGDGLVVATAWWWRRLGGDGLVMRTAWWWERLDDENNLMMRTTWWWKQLDDENDLLVRWWIYTAVKSFYLILSNLRFRTISRVGFERRTIAKTRLDSSNKNFCSTRGLNRVGLFDMSETQSCGQSRMDDMTKKVKIRRKSLKDEKKERDRKMILLYHVKILKYTLAWTFSVILRTANINKISKG